MEVQDVGRTLWRRRYWAIGAFLAVSLSAALAGRHVTPVYQSSVKILLFDRNRSLSAIGQSSDVDQLTSLSRTGGPLDTELELLKSAPIVQQAISRADLRSPGGQLLTPEQMLKKTKVTILNGSDILEVSVENRDPKKARDAAGAWASAFLAENRSGTRQEVAAAVQLLSRERDQARTALDAADTALRDFRQANLVVDLSEEAKAFVTSRNDIEQQWREASANLVEAQARCKLLRSRIGMDPSDAMLATAISQEPQLQRLRQKLADVEFKLLDAQSKFAADSPEIRQARHQVESIRHLLESTTRLEFGKRKVATNLDPVRQSLTQDLVNTEINVAGLQARVSALQGMLGPVSSRLAQLPGIEFESDRLQRNVETLTDRYHALDDQLRHAELQVRFDLGNGRIIEPASLPTKPANHSGTVVTFLGSLFGLVFGVGVAWLRDKLDRSMKTPAAAERALQLRPLGRIPWLKTVSAPLVAHAQPRSAVAAAYRALRTNLRFLTAKGSLTAIGFTSTIAGEGKSTTVANLGVSMARAGKRVLILDADVRMPSQHVLFGLRNDLGLTSVLQESARIADAIQQTSVERLDVMTAGRIPDDPTELLESSEMGRLLEEVLKQYDLVLMDFPPILEATDATVVGARLGGLILVVDPRRVSEAMAKRALESMLSNGIEVLGMVLRGLAPEPTYGYYKPSKRAS